MKQRVLISGASFAGLATAYWMNQRGYEVTVVEMGGGLKQGGTPVNIREHTVDIVKRMGLLDRIRANPIQMELTEYKNADDVTEASEVREPLADDEYEIERDVLLHMMFDAVKDEAQFIFDDSIASLEQHDDIVDVTFRSGQQHVYDLVFGCDGIHSVVRKLCFGEEAQFAHFLNAYFSITIVDKLLILEHTTQMYNEPDRMVMVNAYNGKTDIVLCLASDYEIPYDYRNEQQQRAIMIEHFSGMNWRVPELLDEVQQSPKFYFDKMCQMRMPSWTQGRVALVGDAGYCASPAAGMGGSLAIDGAAALADAFEQHDGDVVLAFQTYNRGFRPFIEEVQETAQMMVQFLIPRTAEAIRERHSQ
ncbi:FAD-dependent monooxygenase [Paenibacillus wenxiniae]|uniref:FAD-dependent monooxygenase n=1 Tax=Paenibacillus wenxiniae TaxID=1636843 RepID=A0ABW4REW0_9BACL